MKSQFIGTLLLLLVIGQEAANVRRALITNHHTREAIKSHQKHRAVAKGKIVNDLKEIDVPMIIDLLLGDVCVLVSPELAAKLDKIYEQGMAAGGGGEAAEAEAEAEPTEFLDKHAKVHHTVSRHHRVGRLHTKAKIVVVDDIIAVLSVIGVALEAFSAIKKFLDGGISAEKREAFEAWLGTGESALETAKTKLRQFEKWFSSHGETDKDEDIRTDLTSLKDAVEALSNKVDVIRVWMQKAIDESNWEYKTSTNVIFGILTAGIWNVVDKTTQRVNINAHRNRAFCAGEALPALVSRVSIALSALHTDVSLVMAH